MSGAPMDIKRVNAAVKIKISIDRRRPQTVKQVDKRTVLKRDLERLINGMTSEEYSEYSKRVV